MISAQDILDAQQRINPYVHHTPVFTNSQLDEVTGSKVFLKCENFQKVGAFKARGAFNFALQIPEKNRKNGLCTHSSGNHAQAVALAAKTLKVPAFIVMPENAPQAKVDAVIGYGAQITFCKATLDARESTLSQIQQQSDAVFIPPYNHEHIIAGAASAAKELLEHQADLDLLIAPIGGGGLLAGTALASRYFGNNTTVYGAEPEGADDAKRSLDKGELIPSVNPRTIADGLLTSVGEVNFEILQKNLNDILLVNEDEIKGAMKFIWERMKIIIEPSSAVAVAAVLRYQPIFTGKKVGLIISGGNLDLNKSYF